MATERDLIERVAGDLRGASIPFRREVAVGGVAADFAVDAPDGRRILIETKAWEKAPGFRNRAVHQRELIREAVDADLVLLVVDNLERSSVANGVVTLDRLVPVLLEELAKDLSPAIAHKALSTSPKPHVFAAMPFDPVYDDTFFVAMVPAAESVNAVCKRVDQEVFSGDIVDEIQSLIRGSIGVIVDLSGGNPNVLYEAGFAHALRKPTLHICSTPLSELPFDVAQWNTIAYRRGQVYRLRSSLASGLQALLG